MRCLFLYNPNSGKGKIAKKLPLIERSLKRRFKEVVCRATQSGEDLERQARTGAEEFDALIFSGGDGTFNHVLQGIGERDIPLGYLPSGTANDVAKSLGIPKRLKRALKVIEGGREARVDCMRVNGERYAMYIAAAGAFTCVTYDTPQREKQLLGKAAYAAEGFKHLDYQPFSLKLTCGGETKEMRAALVFVLSGRFVAGFPVNKRASVQDGILEVVVIKQAKRTNFFSRLKTMCSLAHLFLFGRSVKKKDIVVLRGER
ncbi:MAG: YegS/Rv2252/BmrU family lipid kinase, partial [Clostridiales bacterium]|nr:YegS/Rv2252/BmrU family lipid kinase [Clostridiales bacterium]